MVYLQNICIAIITEAKDKQVNVFGVSILSLRKIYVIIANTKFETPKPRSFEAHTSPVSATTLLIACHKQKPAGTANKRLATSGLSLHHSQTN
tara:strand:+ start:201 stop:479 length:279 start_codon:yes stop_codon:yes gene_type:complete